MKLMMLDLETLSTRPDAVPRARPTPSSRSVPDAESYHASMHHPQDGRALPGPGERS